jgi:hypothetical protein
VCGNTDMRVLEINHIHNDGNWRKRAHHSGFNIRDLRDILGDIKIRKRLEVLCANCHALRTKGYI